MSASIFHDTDNYQEQVVVERSSQAPMDNWYRSCGYEIVNRTGTVERDLVLKIQGRNYKVEEKYRTADYGDFLIELIQDVTTNMPGWFYAEKFDFLNYVILDNNKKPKTAYWIQFDRFKGWFYMHLATNKFPSAVISPDGNGLTLNIAIPWYWIPANICKRYEITGDL